LYLCVELGIGVDTFVGSNVSKETMGSCRWRNCAVTMRMLKQRLSSWPNPSCICSNLGYFLHTPTPSPTNTTTVKLEKHGSLEVKLEVRVRVLLLCGEAVSTGSPAGKLCQRCAQMTGRRSTMTSPSHAATVPPSLSLSLRGTKFPDSNLC
jgi:hypothetical protein